MSTILVFGREERCAGGKCPTRITTSVFFPSTKTATNGSWRNRGGIDCVISRTNLLACVCHLCEQLAEITTGRLSAEPLVPLHRRAVPSGSKQSPSPSCPVNLPSLRLAQTDDGDRRRRASLVINITLNTSRRPAKTPIWDRSNAR